MVGRLFATGCPALATLLTRLSPEVIETIVSLPAPEHATGENMWQGAGASDPELGTFFDPTSPEFLSALATGNLPGERLRELLMGLSAEQRIEPMALMWLGRADGDMPGRSVREVFAECCDHARQNAHGDGDIGYWLMEKPLHLYLSHATAMDIDGVVTPVKPACFDRAKVKKYAVREAPSTRQPRARRQRWQARLSPSPGFRGRQVRAEVALMR